MTGNVAKPFIVALEKHDWDRALHRLFEPRDARRGPAVEERLFDCGSLCLRETDEAGIDVQVLSDGSPGVQPLEAELAVRTAREAILGGNAQRLLRLSTWAL
jgi:hypothetical protein